MVSWGDITDLSDGSNLKRDLVGYAYTTVNRTEAGKALLCLGSDESIRVWVNGTLIFSKITNRPLTADEDQMEVDLKKGENSLLIKLEQRVGPWNFSARILETGAPPARIEEISPSLRDSTASTLMVKTDANNLRANLAKTTIQVIGAGGKVLAEKVGARGDRLEFNPTAWTDGPYEVRCTTQRLNGLRYTTHLAWYKGDALVAARELVKAGAKADLHTPAGFNTKMLADMVLDRLGQDLDKVKGNPWWAIHSPLMEFEEMKMETKGISNARVRPYGFYRLAYRDEVDGSPQYCRAYLPGGYDPAKKWPLVIKLHGYNPANPEYVRWWAADSRHSFADSEYAGHQGIIYVEPHGRGNTQYLGLGDQDVVRVIQLAKEKFKVDENRVYLMGDSMGGWGTWNVGTRHPELFAALAPIFGGVDYHSQLTEEALGKLTPLERYFQDKQSSWSTADSLLNMPILVLHGDVDQAVNVEYSRYGVRMLERWGYDIRYVEFPGYGHEDLNYWTNIFNWFLQHRREAHPSRVRIRSAELKNASAYWAKIEQAASPREFMVVDAEIVDTNTIRLDSQNVLSVTLSPGSSQIDPAKPVKVIWNGENHKVTSQSGQLKLLAHSYSKGKLEKNAKTNGPLSDIYNTPFAIVIGTASKDQAMKEMCQRKADAVIRQWKDWQRQPPRAFKDTELSDADAALYSLILIGGAEANLVSRKLAGQLPFEISPEKIKIGDRTFEATDARLQAIYPNPLNPQRYVLLVAGTSADGLFFWVPDQLRNLDVDFTIEDGRVSGSKMQTSRFDLLIAAGWFDYHWQLQDDLLFQGNPEQRAKSMLLHAPRPDRIIDSKILDSYVGNYQIMPEFVVKVLRQGNRLMAQPREDAPVELLPVNETEFFILEGPVQIIFVKDDKGMVISFKGWQNGQEFTGRKIN